MSVMIDQATQLRRIAARRAPPRHRHRRHQRQGGRRQEQHRRQPGDQARRRPARTSCCSTPTWAWPTPTCSATSICRPICRTSSPARRNLREVMVDGPGGFQLIGGASGLARMADLTDDDRQRLVTALAELEARSGRDSDRYRRRHQPQRADLHPLRRPGAGRDHARADGHHRCLRRDQGHQPRQRRIGR